MNEIDVCLKCVLPDCDTDSPGCLFTQIQRAHTRPIRGKYNQSDKGKAVQSKYEQSAKGKARHKRYRQSAKGKAVRQKIAKKAWAKVKDNPPKRTEYFREYKRMRAENN